MMDPPMVATPLVKVWSPSVGMIRPWPLSEVVAVVVQVTECAPL